MSEEKQVIEIIEKMGEFMRNTNQMLADFKIQISNQQIDIDKLKKPIKQPQLIIPSGISNGGNGGKKGRIF